MEKLCRANTSKYREAFASTGLEWDENASSSDEEEAPAATTVEEGHAALQEGGLSLAEPPAELPASVEDAEELTTTVVTEPATKEPPTADAATSEATVTEPGTKPTALSNVRGDYHGSDRAGKARPASGSAFDGRVYHSG